MPWSFVAIRRLASKMGDCLCLGAPACHFMVKMPILSDNNLYLLADAISGGISNDTAPVPVVCLCLCQCQCQCQCQCPCLCLSLSQNLRLKLH